MIRAVLRALLPFLVTALLAGCQALAPSPERLVYPELTFHLPEVEKRTLPNGIRLYLKPDHELPLVQITAMVGAGALGTPEDKTGFDQVFSAAWRTGGAGDLGPDALEERLDRLAADLGANLGPYTAQLDLSLRTADLAEGVALLGDLLRRPGFAADRLELARLQAREQVRRQNDDPGAIAHRLLMDSLYPDHYLGRSPTLASLDAISREDLVAFHRDHFAPDNLWLAVSGDFDMQELLAQLDAVFDDWARRELAPQEISAPALPGDGVIRFVDKDLAQTTILIGDVGLTKDHPDQYAVRVMNYILGGGGFNSRLMREIRSNRGLAYSAYSYFQVGRRLPGPFIAATETNGESVVEVLGLMRELMVGMREHPVTGEELALARESLVNSFVFGFENAHAVVSQQMSFDFYGYPDDYLSGYRARIAAVTADDVQRVAREFLRPDRQQVVVVGNGQDFSAGLDKSGWPVIPVSLDESR